MILVALQLALGAPCEPYAHEDWRTDMDQVDADLGALALTDARQKLGMMQARVRCLNAIARPDHLARLSRQTALVFWFSQDLDSMEQWALASKASATLPWPDGLAAHPFAADFDALTLPDPISLEGRGLAAPDKGAVFANGDLLALPAARPSVPTFIQVTDKRGNLVQAFWQDGAAFPDRLLNDDPTPIRQPRWWEGAASVDAALVSTDVTFTVPARPELPEPEPDVEPEPDTEAETPVEYDAFQYVDDPASP